jgi:hypothetical protein
MRMYENLEINFACLKTVTFCAALDRVKLLGGLFWVSGCSVGGMRSLRVDQISIRNHENHFKLIGFSR